jgi:hypothetical protein
MEVDRRSAFGAKPSKLYRDISLPHKLSAEGGQLIKGLYGHSKRNLLKSLSFNLPGPILLENMKKVKGMIRV